MPRLYSAAKLLQGADRIDEAINKRQYEAALSVAVELYPEVHSQCVAAQAANAAARVEISRLKAELTRAQTRLTQSDEALVRLQDEQRSTARSLLHRLESSKGEHDCMHDVTELLKVQHPAAAASFLEAGQE